MKLLTLPNAAIVGVLLLAAALRLPTLGNRSLWLDEAVVAHAGSDGLWSAIQQAKTDWGGVPLDYVLISNSISLLGRSEWAVRLPAALLGLASVFLLYYLGKVLAGRETGIVAALLLAVSPAHLWYSQEARFYSLSAFMAILTTLLFVIALRSGRRWAWAGYGISCVLALYSHYYLALVIGLHVGSLLLSTLLNRRASDQRNWISMSLVLGLTALAFLPWLLWVTLPQATGPRPMFFQGPPLEFGFLLRVMGQLIANNNGDLWRIPLAITVLPLAMAAYQGWIKRQALILAILGFVLIIPLVVLLIDRQQSYFFASRQLIYLLPFLCLLLAYGAVEIWETWRPAAVVGLGLVGAYLVFSAIFVGQQWSDQKTDFRDAGAYLEANVSGEDRIGVFLVASLGLPFYYDPEPPQEIQMIFGLDALSSFLADTPGRTWFVASPEDLGAPWVSAGFEGILNSDMFTKSEFLGLDLFVSDSDPVWPGYVAIKAKGTRAGGFWPRMQLWVNGRLVAEWNVAISGFFEFVGWTPLLDGENEIDVVFVNPSLDGSASRVLEVDYVSINGRMIEAEDPSVSYDRGQVFDDDVNVIPGQQVMPWRGALRFDTRAEE